jgi:Skp family chaperone for outer membrane proteins
VAAGMAPITNAKTMEIVEDRILSHQTQVVQNFKEDFKNYDGKLKDLDTNVKALSESNTRVDERTRQIIDEQKQQRDIQNKILMELQNSNKPKT